MSAGELIGPLTAEEWCRFRMRDDNDLLLCCSVTSNFRDALFTVLRMGGDRSMWMLLRRRWEEMDEHGWLDLEENPAAAELLAKLKAFYIDTIPAEFRREETAPDG